MLAGLINQPNRCPISDAISFPHVYPTTSGRVRRSTTFECDPVAAAYLLDEMAGEFCVC